MNLKNLILKRILAFLIDYLVIALYACLLFLISIQLQNTEDGLLVIAPARGQLIGFLTLTLPVFLYFFLTENSRHHATFGKRVLKIKIEKANGQIPQSKNIFIRNLLKFLPWEFAHAGVHWIVYYSSANMPVPVWVYILLCLPQLLLILYFISVVISRGHSSLYDQIAGTRLNRLIVEG